MTSPFQLIGSLESFIRRAKAGHKKDAQLLAKGIAQLLREDKPLPDQAKQYLVDALQEVADGKPGNQAFHTSGKRGVKDGDGKDTYWCMLAYMMQQLLDEGEAESPHEASLLVEAEFEPGPDASTIRKYHRKHFPS